MSAAMIEIGRLLGAQDNRATAHPLFIVQQRERIYGFDAAYGEAVWLFDGKEVDTEERDRLEAKYQESGDEPGDYTRTSYIDRWEFVTCCFTAAAALAYIDAQKHNLNEPRVYAESLHRNPEMIAVRGHLAELAREELEARP